MTNTIMNAQTRKQFQHVFSFSFVFDQIEILMQNNAKTFLSHNKDLSMKCYVNSTNFVENFTLVHVIKFEKNLTKIAQ